MQKEVKKLLELVKNMDSDASISEHFVCLIEKDSKFQSLQSILHQIVHEMYGYDCIESGIETKKIMEKLNYRYFHNQHRYCWHSHMSHFHMSLRDWINCPMTCLTEIQEFLEKIIIGD